MIVYRRKREVGRGKSDAAMGSLCSFGAKIPNDNWVNAPVMLPLC